MSGPPPTSHAPVELRFGTSGLRGLVRDMTDLEIYINSRGFLDYLLGAGELQPGEAVALAEDLRDLDPSTGLESSPRIARAAALGVTAAGLRPLHCGQVPTPALALWAAAEDERSGKRAMPCIMVTGSHIPADRNGVKFYRKGGEILKADEPGILAAVKAVRQGLVVDRAARTLFGPDGMLAERPAELPIDREAGRAYVARYVAPWAGCTPLAGANVVVYQHSAVGRDLLVQILEALGARTEPVERSARFVPVDTEDVSSADEERFRTFASRYQPDAIVSTDGDSDRPLCVDETGRFHRGDVLGIVTAEWLGARFAAVPVSTTDALDLRLAAHAKEVGAERRVMVVEKTRIGSPFVIAAMQRAVARGAERVVGWEANGGFLTASAFPFGEGTLSPLPTRDAVLPLLAVLLTARQRKVKVSEVFAALPARATRAGLLDEFPVEHSRAIVERLSPSEPGILELRFEGSRLMVQRQARGATTLVEASEATATDALRLRAGLQSYFTTEQGFGELVRVNYLDGVRAFFANGDIAHLRPSGNAPQLRLYAVSGSQQRADEIVELAMAEPDGLLRRMARELTG
jgi:phosphomannomutase